MGITSSGQVLGGGGGGGGGTQTPVYALVVQVKDLNGVAIQSATVSVGSQSLLTDSQGLVTFGSQLAGTYAIHIEASGCTASDQSINLQSDHGASNPLQISIACGSQQTTATGGVFTIPQIEQITLPLIGFSLLGVAAFAYIEHERRKHKREKEAY
jgi:hypothetical protein